MRALLLCLIPALPACLGSPPRVTHASQSAPTTASLRGVSAVSPEVCWASGAGGTFLRTIDGGATWAAGVVDGAEDLAFRDVEALDANTALLMSAGRPAEVWRPRDGGVTWDRRERLDVEGVFLDAMDLEGDYGLAWGDPLEGAFLTLETTDGGLAWRRVGAQLPAPLAGEAGFAASGTCVAVRGERIWVGTGGGAARVLVSGDRGQTWTATEAPMQQGTPTQGIFSVAFADEERGAIVGGDYDSPETTHGTAAYTTDGGLTWSAARSQHGYRSCVAATPLGEPAWLVSISKVGASASTDGGARWRPIDLPGHYALDFAPQPWLGGRAVGWAVGAKGRVLRVEVWP